jgi:hypothetical protein
VGNYLFIGSILGVDLKNFTKNDLYITSAILRV